MSEETKQIVGKKLETAIFRAQLEKLSLEIEQMKYRSKWHDRLAPYSSLLTVIIGVGAFLFGIFQFSNQREMQLRQQTIELDKFRYSRELELNTEIQKQLNTNLERLLQYAKEEKTSVAMTTYTLSSLRTYIKAKARIKQGETEPTNEEIDNRTRQLTREITEMLVYSVKNDCDFNESRNAYFVSILLSDWRDLSQYLREHPDDAYYIIYRFKGALDNFYSIDESIVSNVTYVDKTGSFSYERGYGSFTGEQVQHFHYIIANYKYIFDLIEDNEKKELMGAAFQSATCNRKLTKQMLNIDINPKGKAEFRGCPGY